MKPHELDLDITGLRAAKLAELYEILHDLEELNTVERVLHKQMNHTGRTLTTLSKPGVNGRGRLLLPAGAAGELEEDEPQKTRKRRRRSPVDIHRVQDEIMLFLTRAVKKKIGPSQSSEIKRSLTLDISQSTLNRALLILRQDKRILMIKPHKGALYPTYTIPNDTIPNDQPTPAAPPAVAPKRRRKRAYNAKGNGIAAGVIRALTDGDAKGMTLPEIVQALEQDGQTKFLEGYAHGTQVSWALKGHRNAHRLETIEQKNENGMRIHRLLRPKISVTKG